MSSKPNPAAGIGKDIRDARESLDWSQHKLASEAGVSRPTIARVETGSNISTVVPLPDSPSSSKKYTAWSQRTLGCTEAPMTCDQRVKDLTLLGLARLRVLAGKLLRQITARRHQQIPTHMVRKPDQLRGHPYLRHAQPFPDLSAESSRVVDSYVMSEYNNNKQRDLTLSSTSSVP